MNVLVVDTSSWISYLNGSAGSVGDLELALKEGRVWLSPLVLAELLSPGLNPGERARLIDFLRELPLFDADFEHWRRVGILRADLSRKGLNLSTPDAHVAQVTLDLEGYLLTEDAIFAKVRALAPLRLI